MDEGVCRYPDSSTEHVLDLINALLELNFGMARVLHQHDTPGVVAVRDLDGSLITISVEKHAPGSPRGTS